MYNNGIFIEHLRELLSYHVDLPVPYNFKKTHLKLLKIYILLLSVTSARADKRSRYSEWLLAGRPRGRSSSPGRINISLLHVVQTGSWAHLVSYPMDTEGSFPAGKAAGA
jgi:hypothetical protein